MFILLNVLINFVSQKTFIIDYQDATWLHKINNKLLEYSYANKNVYPHVYIISYRNISLIIFENYARFRFWSDIELTNEINQLYLSLRGHTNVVMYNSRSIQDII